MAAGPGGSIDGPGGAHRGGWEGDEEDRPIPGSPEPLPADAKSLAGRVSWQVPGKTHIVIARRIYKFPIEMHSYLEARDHWTIQDLFRMTPPIPRPEDSTQFDFCSQSSALDDWLAASIHDGGGDEITEEVEERIADFFSKPLTLEEERNLRLVDFKDLRPEGITEAQFQAVGAKLVYNSVFYYSFEHFLSRLRVSVDAYIEYLTGQISNGTCDKLVFVFPPGTETKSNVWVARLAYDQFKEHDCAPTEFLTVREFNKQRGANPRIRGVTFDDCSYSGSQLSMYFADTPVDVIVPFCTDQAADRIRSSIDGAAFLAPYVSVPTLADLGLRRLELICTAADPFYEDDVESGAFVEEFSSRTLLFFEHKAADEISVLTGLIEGFRFPFGTVDRPTGIEHPLRPPGAIECYKNFMGVGLVEE